MDVHRTTGVLVAPGLAPRPHSRVPGRVSTGPLVQQGELATKLGHLSISGLGEMFKGFLLAGALSVCLSVCLSQISSQIS